MPFSLQSLLARFSDIGLEGIPARGLSVPLGAQAPHRCRILTTVKNLTP